MKHLATCHKAGLKEGQNCRCICSCSSYPGRKKELISLIGNPILRRRSSLKDIEFTWEAISLLGEGKYIASKGRTQIEALEELYKLIQNI